MKPSGGAALAALIALTCPALALPPCVGVDLATPLPEASEVTLSTMDIPAARFPGLWQQGQFAGFAYRIFPDLTAIVFDERANTGWRIDLLCTEASRCTSTVVGSAPQAAQAAAKAIGDCLMPIEKPAPPLAPPPRAAAPAPSPEAKPVPAPSEAKPAPVPSEAKPVPPSSDAKPAPATPSLKQTATPAPKAPPAPAVNPVPAPPATKPATPAIVAKPADMPPGGKAATSAPAAVSPDRPLPATSAATPATAQSLAAKPAAKTASPPTLKPSQPSIEVAPAPAQPKPARSCPAPSSKDAGSTMRAIQRLLLSTGADPGPIDGVRGKRTVLALEATLGTEIAKLDPVSVLIALTAMMCAGDAKPE
jgi:hypothetical protein